MARSRDRVIAGQLLQTARARWGSRFLQTDLIEGGSSNDYDYAAGDPINNTDLNGEWCLGGFGTTCTRYVKDQYRRSVPVQNRIRQKIETRHGISWSTQKWLIQNLNQVGTDGTRVLYGGTVGEYRCSLSGGCSPTGRTVDVRMTVDFRTSNGRTFGLVTMYCVGRPDLCPSWINTRIKV